MQSPGPTPDLLSQSLHLAEVSRGSGCCGFAKPGGIPNPAEPSAGPTGLVSREAVGFAHRDGLCRALMSGTENPALAAASEARGAGSPGTCQNTLSPGPAPDLPGLSVGWGLGAAQAQGTLTDSRAPDTLPGSTGTRRRGGRRALPRGTAVRAASAQGGLRAGHGPPPQAGAEFVTFFLPPVTRRHLFAHLCPLTVPARIICVCLSAHLSCLICHLPATSPCICVTPVHPPTRPRPARHPLSAPPPPARPLSRGVGDVTEGLTGASLTLAPFGAPAVASSLAAPALHSGEVRWDAPSLPGWVCSATGTCRAGPQGSRDLRQVTGLMRMGRD